MALLPRRWLAVAGLVVAAGVFFLWQGSDERQIGRQVKRLQELVSKGPTEGALAGAGRAREISALFADPFEIDAEPVGLHLTDRRSLIGAIQAYRARSRTISMRIHDRRLDVDDRSRRATLHMTAEFLSSMADLTGREAYRLQVNWVEREGEWRIDYVLLLEVIEGPAWPLP